MHDAPPPPLDRQGIGRLLRRGAERSDITLNDALPAGLRGFSDVFSKPVREAFDNLPAMLRDVLLLTELAGMTYPEIAAALGIAEGTVPQDGGGGTRDH